MTDDIAGAATYVNGDDGDGVLESSEAWNFAADYVIAVSDPDPLINTVTVSGDDADGEPITPAIDAHTTDLVTSALSVVKSGPASCGRRRGDHLLLCRLARCDQ